MQRFKLITCVMQERLANEIIKMLQDEKKIFTANKFRAKGTSIAQHLDIRQMEVLTVVVEEQRADDIFALIYSEAKIDRPHGGLIFQEALGRSTLYTLPELP